jgi:hypothetical protein
MLRVTVRQAEKAPVDATGVTGRPGLCMLPEHPRLPRPGKSAISLRVINKSLADKPLRLLMIFF